jgi:acetyl-CoA C-acetyltransferase
MLSCVLNAMVDKFNLTDERLGEVNAGAVIKHTRDWNLAREACMSTHLSANTPAITMQQACGTSLQAAMVAAAKIACGQIDSAIAAGTDTVSDVPIVFGKKFSQRLVALGRARNLKSKLGVMKGFGPKELTPVPPSVNEPRTLMSMGEHCELMARTWSIGREEQDELALNSHTKAVAAYKAGFYDDLLVSCEGVYRDNNMRDDSSMESLAKLRTAYDRSSTGTLTAGNSTPLTDGAAAVLLCSEQWARDRGLPIQAYLTHSATAAVDYVGGAGLLMAPTVAVSDMLQRASMKLQDFDIYEIHEAFAAQVLCTLKAWEDGQYCQSELGRDDPLGSIERSRMNPVGSSLALGHPFAATGARIIGTLSKQLSAAPGRKGLISVCTAGGMGLSAILQS